MSIVFRLSFEEVKEGRNFQIIYAYYFSRF
jgi:hypothetical protein